MKKYIIAALALFLAVVSSFAQLPTSGDWNPTTAGAKSRYPTTQTVNLTGHVDLNCTIVVQEGVTLTINGGGYHIYNKADSTKRDYGMFFVQAGGKLIINGASGNRIILGGGGNFATPTYSTTNISANGGIIEASSALAKNANTIEMTAPAILNQGVVELNWVTIQNVSNTRYDAPNGSSQTRYTGGAVVHGGSATSTKMSNCIINQIKAQTGAGVYAVSTSNGKIEITDTEFKNCINYTTHTGLHGGVIRGWGNSGADITLTRVKIHHCFSAADGGAIYFPSNGTNSTSEDQAQLTFNGCEFYNNCSYLRGGALDICANLNLTGSVTKVHHNFVQHDGSGTAGNGAGGGISFRGYDSGSAPSGRVDVEYNANHLLEVYNNKSYRGAGIAFYASKDISLANNSTFTLNVNGAKIHDNETLDDGNTPPGKKGYGGGIWMRNDDGGTKGYEFNLNLNSGDIYSNTAQYGGGLFINKWDVNSSPEGTITVRKNRAVKNGDYGGSGGAIYLENSHYVMESGTIGGSSADRNEAENNGGGICLTGSEFSFKAGNVSYNKAESSGGGVMLTGSSSATFSGGNITYNSSGALGGGVAIMGGSTFTFSNGNVKYNIAEDSGGGLYCNASILKFDNGECCDNTAEEAGGGLCVLKEGVVTFKGNIKGNTAKRGGGIALNTGASFTMKGGIISGNKAICEVTGANTTAYNARNNGFGGGICLYNYDLNTLQPSSTATSLTIDVSGETPFGLYGNEASIGGNDITSCGVQTSVTIPNVKSMELAGFEYSDANPNWYEDYNKLDANYFRGTNLDDATKDRYANQLIANTYLKHLVSFEGDSHTYTNYLNLTLGYELLRIIISAKNLLNGESAMFRLTYSPGTATEKSWSVVLTGDGSPLVSKTVRNLNYGQYEAVPVSWQWNYTVDPSAGYSGDIQAGPEKKYLFTLTRQNSPLKTDEQQVVNQLIKPTH